MPALWIAILVGRLFLTSPSLSLFSPGQPDHPQEECQAQAAVARSLFSWRNKSPSLLGYLKCEAKPKASSHYRPCGMSPQSPALDVTILVIRCTDFKTRRYFIHQKWGLTPVGNWQNYFYPAKVNYTHKIPHPFMKLLLANAIRQDLFLTLNSLSSFPWPTCVTGALTHIPP